MSPAAANGVRLPELTGASRLGRRAPIAVGRARGWPGKRFRTLGRGA